MMQFNRKDKVRTMRNIQIGWTTQVGQHWVLNKDSKQYSLELCGCYTLRSGQNACL